MQSLQNLVIDTLFFSMLLEIDQKLAQKTREKGCPRCGGRLHSATYPRKPRGLLGCGNQMYRRLSFCCSQCRKRELPPSVRFLGRKVYVGSVVILAMSKECLQAAAFSVCRQTLRRWRAFWNAALDRTSSFWKKAQCFLSSGFEWNGTPIPIVEFFWKKSENNEHWFSDCLSFFSPLSIGVPSGKKIKNISAFSDGR